MLDGAVPVDAATTDATIIADASATDVDDLDGPRLIGPDADVVRDAYVAPDVCIALYDPYEPDSSGMCITWVDCCQPKPAGASCQDGRCIGNHQQ
jgi:hypothetical protein